MQSVTYPADTATALRFPLSGIGTGGILLSDEGNPDFYRLFGKTERRFFRFALRTDRASGESDIRLLSAGARENGSLPHCEPAPFLLRFPYVRLPFTHTDMPCKLSLCAYNPFLPLNHIDSGIPAAFFEWELHNTGSETVRCTLCAAAENPLEHGINRFDGDIRCDMKALCFLSEDDADDDGALQSSHNAKNLCLATDSEEVSYREYVDVGGDGSNLLNLLANGVPLKNTPREKGNAANDSNRSNDSEPLVGALCAHITLAAGEKKTVRFVLAHYMRHAADRVRNEKVSNSFYGRFFSSAKDCAAYCFLQWERLKNETDRFASALGESTLPDTYFEALSADLTAIKSPYLVRCADNTLCDADTLAEKRLPNACALNRLFSPHFWQSAKLPPDSSGAQEAAPLGGYEAAGTLLCDGKSDEEAFELIHTLRHPYLERGGNPFGTTERAELDEALGVWSTLEKICGFCYDKEKMSLSFEPLLRFSDKDGYFKCVFGAETAYGTVEAGPKYVEMKLLRGELSLKSFGIFAEPKVLYFGGRKLDFHAEGTHAVLDFDLKCTPEKGITIIYD